MISQPKPPTYSYAQSYHPPAPTFNSHLDAMTTTDQPRGLPLREQHDAALEPERVSNPKPSRWKSLFSSSKASKAFSTSRSLSDGYDEIKIRPEKWSLGVLNDKETDEVPGKSWTTCFSHHAGVSAPHRARTVSFHALLDEEGMANTGLP